MAKILTYLGSFRWLGGRKFAGLQEAFLLMYMRPDIAPYVMGCYGIYCGMNIWEGKKNATE